MNNLPNIKPSADQAADRAYFVAAVTHPDGYNGATRTAYVCFDQERQGLIAVYPHGWHICPPDIAAQAVRINGTVQQGRAAQGAKQ